MTLIDPKTLRWTLRSAGSDRKIAKLTQKKSIFKLFPCSFRSTIVALNGFSQLIKLTVSIDESRRVCNVETMIVNLSLTQAE
jgi:hypothetical protein